MIDLPSQQHLRGDPGKEAKGREGGTLSHSQGRLDGPRVNPGNQTLDFVSNPCLKLWRIR